MLRAHAACPYCVPTLPCPCCLRMLPTPRGRARISQVEYIERYKEMQRNHEEQEMAAQRMRERQAQPQQPQQQPQQAQHPSSASPGVARDSAAALNASAPNVSMPHAWLTERRRISGEHVRGYTWDDYEDEVEVHVPLPADATSGSVDVRIGSRTLLVALNGFPLIDGKTVGRVDVDASGWSIDRYSSDGVSLELTLRKSAADSQMWGHVIYDAKAMGDDDPIETTLRDEEPRAAAFNTPGVE
eukprot:6198840-Pleurochrysis_carterae.AAC.1